MVNGITQLTPLRTYPSCYLYLLTPPKRLLGDTELLVGGGITYAALILFGSPEAVNRHLSQAETIFEFRMSDASTRHVQREEFRAGFFLWHDRLWELINLRNEVLSYPDGLFRWDIPGLDEETVREAVMNSVAHRDYRRPGSVMVRHWPGRLDIVSPGGFPDGVTEHTILSCRRKGPGAVTPRRGSVLRVFLLTRSLATAVSPRRFSAQG